MSKRCPSCKSVVPDDADACPNCPHSFEPDDAHHYVRRRRALPREVPLALVVLLAAIFAVEVWKALSFFIDHGGDPFAGSGPPAIRWRSEAPATRWLPQAAPQGRWRLVGRVFDLVTLQPIPGCRVAALDPDSDAKGESFTDAAGGYAIVVPALKRRGYEMRLSKLGYATSYVNPGADIRAMAPRRRKRLAKELAAAFGGVYSVRPGGRRALLTDFYLAPLSGERD